MDLKITSRKTAAGGCLALAFGLVCQFEGRNLIAYYDPVGIPTICSGVTKGVRMGQTATPEQCDALTMQSLVEHAAYVDRLVRVPISINERAAWISFTYNVGPTLFSKSTALKKLNAGDHVGACNEMTKWVYAGGRKLSGLVKRRESERALCLR